MELKLNIYDEHDKKKLVKTHTTSSYDLMLGTTEDIMSIIDTDKMDNQMEMTKMVVKGYKQLKPLLLDIFPGLTEEELRGIKVKELIPLFANVVNCIMEDLGILQEGN